MRPVFACPTVVMLLACGSACGSVPKDSARFPARAEGCEIAVYVDAPSVATENIGPVTATCGDDIADADCVRTLKDQACKLGADVVWGVPGKPTLEGNKKKLAGRAAHTALPGKKK